MIEGSAEIIMDEVVLWEGKAITKEFVVTWAISEAMNAWLRDSRDEVYKFPILLDRVCYIREIVVEATKLGEKRWESFKRRANEKRVSA